MTTTSPLRDRLRAELVAALRNRDKQAASAFRAVLAALENAEAVPIGIVRPAGALEESAVGAGAADVPRRTLTDTEEQAILQAEIADLREAADTYAGAGATDAARSATGCADRLARLADLP